MLSNVISVEDTPIRFLLSLLKNEGISHTLQCVCTVEVDLYLFRFFNIASLGMWKWGFIIVVSVTFNVHLGRLKQCYCNCMNTRATKPKRWLCKIGP